MVNVYENHIIRQHTLHVFRHVFDSALINMTSEDDPRAERNKTQHPTIVKTPHN